MLGSPVKISSAQRAAKSRPRPDEPACSSTGRPCGERGTVSGPRTPEPLAVVVELVDLVGVGEDAATRGRARGRRRPTCPTGRWWPRGTRRPGRSARRGRGGCVDPEVLGLAVVDRRDDVPRGPAAGQVVERGEGAGDVERRVVGRRVRGAEADVAGGAGDARRARCSGRASPGGRRGARRRPPTRRRCRAWPAGRRRTSCRSSPLRGCGRASGSSPRSRKPCSVAGWRHDPA